MAMSRAVRRALVSVTVAAVAMSVCVTLSDAARITTTWSNPMELAPSGGAGWMSSVSCPTTSQCTAVDWSGQELTFDPQTPGAAQRHEIAPADGQLFSVDCPSAQQCTAVDGGSFEITFDPVTGAVQKTANVASANLESVSCPSVSLCTAVGTVEVAFNPLTGRVTPAGVTSFKSDFLAGVSCVSTTQCTSVDQPGFARTFNPNTGQLNAAGIVRLGGGTMTSVTCPTASECVGGDGSGNEIPFNPLTGNRVGPGNENWGMGVRTLSISCVSASSCTSVDYGGGERTFDPQTGTLDSPGLTALNAGSLNGVACLAAMGCVAAGATGNEVTFDPAAPGTAVVTAMDTARGLIALACPSATQCTAVGVDASEETFDPTTGSVLSSTTEAVDTRPFVVTACPSTTQCTAVLYPTFAVNDTVTFDPQTGAANGVGLWTSLSGAHAPSGIACPSLTQCTLVDTSGDEVTFDPTTGVRDGSVLHRLKWGSQALVCPTATQCTVLSNGGDELTFDPTNGSFTTNTPVRLAPLSVLPFTAMSCPASDQCSAVATDGLEITFDPNLGVALDGGAQTLDPGHNPSAISCPTKSRCVAVDTSARSVTFNPAQPGAQSYATVPEAAALNDVTCVSTATCVAVDGIGQAFAGDNSTVPAPDTEITAGPTDPTYRQNAAFSFSSYDTAATFKCSLDGAGWQACSSPASYSGLSAGSHTFEVQAWDGSLSDPAPPSQTWTIVPPDTTITAGPGNHTAAKQATFSFSSGDAKATFQCRLDSAGWQTCTSPATYSALSTGMHGLQVRAVDGSFVDPTPASRTWGSGTVKLSIARAGKGTGTVTSSPAGIACGAKCSKPFGYASPVTLTARPSKTSSFAGWSGGGCTGKGKCVVDMNGARSVTATFTLLCIVPNVRGKTLAGAQKAIAKTGCTLGTVTTKASGRVKKGSVLSQSPAPGKKRPTGTPVNLVVSSG